MESSVFFCLFPHCYIVKGKNNDIVYNSQRSTITYITRDVTDLIEMFNKYSILEVGKRYADDRLKLDNIISFLFSKKLIFKRDKIDDFPIISLKYDTPEYISYLVIEYSDFYNLKLVVNSINRLLVKYLEVRIIPEYATNINEQQLIDIFEILAQSTLRSIQIVVDYSLHKLINTILKKIKNNKVCKVIYFNSELYKIVERSDLEIVYLNHNYEYILYYNNNYNNNIILSFNHFIESHTYNSYYNKRMAINRYGIIKNCLKNDREYGSIKNNNLLDIAKSEKFQELWFASVDKIIDLKDNALRYNMYITNNLEKVVNSEYYKLKND